MNARALECAVAPLVAALIFVTGCQTVPLQGAQPPPDARNCLKIGTLRLAGQKSVSLNWRQARDNTQVCDGDSLSTGAGSSAYVYFSHGGYVQFDESTDPIFRLLQDLVIEIAGLKRGQIFVATSAPGKVIVRTPDGDMETAGTKFNLRVDPLQSILTVVDGRVRMMRPDVGLMEPNEQAGFERGAIQYRRVLSFLEMQQVIGWRARYPLREPEAQPPDTTTSSNVGAVAIPIIGAIIGGWIVRDALSDDSDDDGDYPDPDAGSGGDSTPGHPTSPRPQGMSRGISRGLDSRLGY